MFKITEVENVKESENIIKVSHIIETAYENNTCWVSYSFGNKYGYAILEGDYIGKEKEVEQKYNEDKELKESLIDKPLLNDTCSKKLAELFNECVATENDMWFIEEDEIENEELEQLQEEVDRLELHSYIEFGDDPVVTVYGGFITKYLCC